jgi:hypothetical protein
MSYQIFNDSACIRIQLTNAPNDVKVLMVVKEQIKTVDIIKSNIVRIDIGEGPLKNIYLNYQEVTFPTVTSAEQLRDHIISLLKSDINDGDNPSEETLQEILGMLLNNYNELKEIKAQGKDLPKLEPILVDESNPNVIYKGWSINMEDTTSPLWAIQRISRSGDIIINEWADGNQFYDNVWDNRLQLQYSPYLSDHFPVT